MPDIKLGSLFDGIGVFPLAASRCGIRPVWASEIEKAPISITKRHFPDMAHLGDARYMLGMKVKDIAAMEGITPSQAGKSIHAALRRLRRYFARQKWTVNL